MRLVRFAKLSRGNKSMVVINSGNQENEGKSAKLRKYNLDSKKPGDKKSLEKRKNREKRETFSTP